MSKKIIVVGAGIAGLTAAIYAQRSGFDVTLIEQHRIAGGMCTSWKRKGYHFEGGVHWQTGTSPKTEVYQIWKDTGALDETVPVYLRDPFHTIEWNGQLCENTSQTTLSFPQRRESIRAERVNPVDSRFRGNDKSVFTQSDGQLIHLYRDIERTAEHLREISPADRPHIDALVKDVKKVSKVQMPITDIKGVKAEHPRNMSLGSLLGMLPALLPLYRLNKISSREYLARFSHPGLRRLFSLVPDRYTATSLIFTLATFQIGDGGYPQGGSLAMVDRMVKTFTDLGGTLLLKTRVEKVLIENGVARGVRLAQDSGEVFADAVVVTQETIGALNSLFDEPLQDEWLKEIRDTTKCAVCTFVCVGVREELPCDLLPEWKLSQPIVYAGRTVNELGFFCYNTLSGYEGYAPEGGTALTTAFFEDTYDYWKTSQEEGRYEADKKALADQVIHALCEKYPQLEGKIEVVDVATPLTYERYTGAYRGSWMSIMEPGDRMKSFEGTVDSVKGLFFAGHRLIPPGGLPTAAASGRTAAQLVCRMFDAVFR